MSHPFHHKSPPPNFPTGPLADPSNKLNWTLKDGTSLFDLIQPDPYLNSPKTEEEKIIDYIKETTIYKLTITTNKTGYTWQRVWSKSKYNQMQKLVPTYQAKLELVYRSNTNQVVSELSSIDVTRDGWYYYAQKGNQYHLINTAFEPVGGKTHFVGAHLHYEHSGENAIKLYQLGSQVFHAQPYPNAQKIGRKKNNVASGVMIHVGGVYNNSYHKRYQLGGSLGCFGVILGDNKFTTKVFDDTTYVNLMRNGTVSNSAYSVLLQNLKNRINSKPFISRKIKGMLVVVQPRKLVTRAQIGKTANGYYNEYWATSKQSDIKIGRYKNFLSRKK